MELIQYAAKNADKIADCDTICHTGSMKLKLKGFTRKPRIGTGELEGLEMLR